MFPYEEKDVKTEIARRLGKSWPDIERRLFGDVAEFHRLAQFDGYRDAESLLARYNVAQVQVALYGAISLTVWATERARSRALRRSRRLTPAFSMSSEVSNQRSLPADRLPPA